MWLPVQPALDQQRPPAHGPSPHGPGAKHLQQSVEVLQFPGRPPAWEHWRENSATVLQTQVDPGAHWHWSCTQACTYSSRGTRPRQPSKALAVSSLSHSARCGRRGRWVGTARPPPSTGPRGSASRHRAVGGRGPQPLTHVLCAGRGGWHLLGVVAYHLGLVDLLHVPKLQDTEEHAWRAQPISGGPRGLRTPTHLDPEEALTIGEELGVGLQAVVVPTEATRVVLELTVQFQLSGKVGAGQWTTWGRTTVQRRPG